MTDAANGLVFAAFCARHVTRSFYLRARCPTQQTLGRDQVNGMATVVFHALEMGRKSDMGEYFYLPTRRWALAVNYGLRSNSLKKSITQHMYTNLLFQGVLSIATSNPTRPPQSIQAQAIRRECSFPPSTVINPLTVSVWPFAPS